MTATQTPNLHSTSAGRRPTREMPVLFHLLDVSRPKGYSAFRPVEPPPESDPAVSESIPTTTQAAAIVTPEIVSEPEVIASNPAAESTASAVPNASAACSDIVASAATEPLLTAPVAVAPSADAASLRQRREERNRKRQTPVKEDWFGLHGKYIAIGFVLALIATIYFARFHGRSPAPSVASHPHAHPGAAAGDAPLVVEIPTDTTPETSPAATAESQSSDTTGTAQVELYPPTQIAEQSPSANPGEKSDDALFPWAKRDEQRLAERPAPPALATPAPVETTAPPSGSAAPASEPSLPAGPPAAAPPVSEPQYPTTGLRSQFQPTTPSAPPAPPAVPVAPSAGAFVPPIATYAPTGGAFVPTAGPEPLYPSTNSASGIRYERTGSGLY